MPPSIVIVIVATAIPVTVPHRHRRHHHRGVQKINCSEANSINGNRNLQCALFFSIIKLKMCAWQRLWVKWRKFAPWYLFFFSLDIIWIYTFFKVFHYSRKAISCRRRQSKKKNSYHLLVTQSLQIQLKSVSVSLFQFPFSHRDISFFRELPDHLTFADCLMAFNIFAFISLIWRFQDFFFLFVFFFGDLHRQGSPECVASIHFIQFFLSDVLILWLWIES